MFDRLKILLMRQLHILDGDVILLVKPGAALAGDMPESRDANRRVLSLRHGHGFGFHANLAKRIDSRRCTTSQRRCRAEHA